jgi:large subunit ribosomal protein L4
VAGCRAPRVLWLRFERLVSKVPQAPLFDARNGEKRSDLDLEGPQFTTEPRKHLMHRAVVAELDARRRFTASTKGRSEVVGSGRKLYRQKGTGRARAGDIKPPNRVSGGTWGGPKPKSKRSHKRINRKEARAAFYGALSAKATDGELYVLDSLHFDKPSTKQAKELLEKLGLEGPTLVIVTEDDEHAALSFRNLPEVRVVSSYEYGVYELLGAREVAFSWSAYQRLVNPRRRPEEKR